MFLGGRFDQGSKATDLCIKFFDVAIGKGTGLLKELRLSFMQRLLMESFSFIIKSMMFHQPT